MNNIPPYYGQIATSQNVASNPVPSYEQMVQIYNNQAADIYNLLSQNSVLQNECFQIKNHVQALEQQLSENNIKQSSPSFIFDFPNAGMHIISEGLKKRTLFSPGVITSGVMVTYDKKCNKEPQMIFNYRTVNGNEINGIKISISELNEKHIFKAFRSCGIILHGDKKHTFQFINYLLYKISMEKVIHVPFHAGWNGSNTEFIAHTNDNEGAAIVPSYIIRQLEPRNLFNTFQQMLRNLFEIVFKPLGRENFNIAFLLFLIMCFLPIQSLFRKNKFDIKQMLVLSGKNLPIVDYLDQIFVYFTREDGSSIIQLDAKKEKAMKECFESKDEVLIFCDPDKSVTNEKTRKEMLPFLVRVFGDKNEFDYEYDKNKFFTAKTESFAVIVSERIHYEVDAEKILAVSLDNIKFNFAEFKKYQGCPSPVPQFVFEIVSHIKKELLRFNIEIKRLANDYYNSVDELFQNESSRETYAVLMATYSLIEMIFNDFGCSTEYELKRLFQDAEYDFAQIILDILIENEKALDTEGNAGAFKDAFIKLVNDASKDDLIFNCKYTTNRDAIIDTKAFKIFYESDYFYMFYDAFDKHVTPKMPYNITTEKLLRALKTANILKPNKEKIDINVTPVTLYYGKNNYKTERPRMIVLFRSAIEETGSSPLI